MIFKLLKLPFWTIFKIVGVIFSVIKLIGKIIFGIIKIIFSHAFGTIIGALTGLILGRKHIGVKLFASKHKKTKKKAKPIISKL